MSFFSSKMMKSSSLSSSTLSTSFDSTFKNAGVKSEEDDISVFDVTKAKDTIDVDIIDDADFDDCAEGDHDIFSPYVGQEEEVGLPVHFHSQEKDENNRAKDVSDKSKFYVDDYNQHTDIINRYEQGGSWLNFHSNFTTNPEITPEEEAHGMVEKKRVPLNNPLGLIFSLNDAHKDVFKYDDGSQLENIYYKGNLTGQKEITYNDGVDIENLKSGDKRIVINRHYTEDGNYIEEKVTQTYDAKNKTWGQLAYHSYLDNAVFEKVSEDIDLSKARVVEQKNGQQTLYIMPSGKTYVKSPNGQIYEKTTEAQNFNKFKNFFKETILYSKGR